jgi:hypothetical protein
MVRLAGFEPATFGSGERIIITLFLSVFSCSQKSTRKGDVEAPLCHSSSGGQELTAWLSLTRDPEPPQRQ